MSWLYSLSHRSSEGFFYGPFRGINAVCEGGVPDTEFIAPLFQSQGSSFPGYVSIAPPVIGLFVPRAPAAILFSVASIIVSTVNGMFCSRWVPHVGKEVLKEVPRLTESDTPTTIVRVTTMALIEAALFHTLPYAIDPGIRQPMCRCCASLEAPTRSGIAGSQVVCLHRRGTPTGTFTVPPSGTTGATFRPFNNSQTSEGTACKVFKASRAIQLPAKATTGLGVPCYQVPADNHCSRPTGTGTQPFCVTTKWVSSPREYGQSAKHAAGNVYEFSRHAGNLHQRLSSLRKYVAEGVMSSLFQPLSLSHPGTIA